MNLDIVYVSAYSYLLGSIPFGLIITKIFLGKDIRDIGSGNIGTTNVLRTGKKSLAAITLLFDILKGYISIVIASKYFNDLIYLSSNQVLKEEYQMLPNLIFLISVSYNSQQQNQYHTLVKLSVTCAHRVVH